MRLKPFDVYEHPTESIDAVKKGFCWPAAFFGWIWALIAKQWTIAAALIGYDIVSSAIAFSQTDLVYASFSQFQPSIIFCYFVTSKLLAIVIAAVVGAKGNDWRAANLLKNGYVLTATVQAKNRQDAMNQIWIKRH